jgi:hypothetical protein
MLVFHSAPEHSWRSIVKRGIDIFGSVTMLLIGSPFFPAVRVVDPAEFSRRCDFSAATLRPPRRTVHDAEVPHHGQRCRAA